MILIDKHLNVSKKHGKYSYQKFKSLIECDYCKAQWIGWNFKKPINYCIRCTRGNRKLLADYINLGKQFNFKYLQTTIPEKTSEIIPNMWRCLKGHTFSVTFTMMKLHHFCEQCRIEDTQKRILLLLTNQNYVFADNKLPLAMNQKFNAMCSNGHIWKTCGEYLQIKRGCHYCNKYYKVCPSTMTEEEKALRRDRWKYREWRRKVHEKSNYTCRCCLRRGGFLTAHHLNGYHWDKDNRYNVENGVSLCKKCHKNFHSIYKSRDNTREQFEEFLKLK